MSDVTGSIGNENVRLRGMALEETQYQILQQLETLTTVTKTKGKPDPIKTKAGKALDQVASSGELANEALKKQPGLLGKMGNALSSAKDELGKFSTVFGTFSRTIRGFDSNIKDTSFAMRQVAASSKGAFGLLARTSAESISQLEEQFEVYKRLSNVGGVTAADFDTMRERASTFGVTMQEYASLIESNFANLRINGKSAGKSMKDLSNVTEDLRENNEGFNNQMMALGYSAHDYGQLILEQTMAMGGLNKVMRDTTQPFAERILNATKNVTALSEAFGFNRDQVMKSANDALKDARNRTIFNSIQTKGKTDLLNIMTGILGDGKKGMDVALSVLTGQYSEEAANLTSWAPELMDSFKVMSQYLAEAPGDLEGAMKKANLDQVMKNLKSNGLAMAQATRFSSDASNQSVLAILNLVDMFGNSTDAAERFAERIKGTGTKQNEQLETLGSLQRENIKLAISFAKTNQMLNNFGLTVGFAMQLITNVMSKTSEGSLKAFTDTFKEMKGPEFVKEMKANGNKVAEDMAKIIKEEYGELPWVKDTQQPARPRADMPTHGPVVNDTPVNIQGKMVKPSDINKSKLEATAGGPTSVYMQQLVAAMAGLDPKIKVTALDDLKHTDGKHPEGMALDFAIPDATKSEIFKAKIQNMMDKLGLKDSDYYVQDEYKNPSPGATGGHMHIQFKSPEAAKKFYEKYGQQYGSPSPATPKNPAPVPAPTPPKKETNEKVSFNPANTDNMLASVGVNSETKAIDKSLGGDALIAFFTDWGDKLIQSNREETRKLITAYENGSDKIASTNQYNANNNLG